MRPTPAVLVVSLALAACRAAAAEPAPPPDDAPAIRTVSAEIAPAFGVATRVRGTIRRQEPNGAKAFEPGLLLTVRSVDGRALPETRGVLAEGADDALAERLAAAAGGGELELVGYETVELHGNPTGVDRHRDLVRIDIPAARDFGVHRSFVVLGLRPAPE